VQPDTVDADGGKALKKSIGIRINRRIEQRIAIHGEIGVDEPQRNGLIGFFFMP
jgi:hypothetical protein